MWTRQQLKTDAKDAVGRNYWNCVVMGLVSAVLVGIIGFTSQVNVTPQVTQVLNRAEIRVNPVVVSTVLSLGGISFSLSFVSLLFNLFLRNPLNVGVDRFFLVNAQDSAALKELIYSFNERRYLNTVGAVLLKKLFIWLGYILLIVPGICLSYSYRMVEYILADEPDMKPMDALRKSKEMMQGNRWKAFVLDLSFLGWLVLNALTFGILGIFYLTPYMTQTNAGLYRALKAEAERG